MPWPWRDRENNGDSLLPIAVPRINGADRDYNEDGEEALERARSTSRQSGHVRTTSAQSRVRYLFSSFS